MGIVVVLALARRAVGLTRSFVARVATRRGVWIRKTVRLALGAVAVLLVASVWFDRPERLATFGGVPPSVQPHPDSWITSRQYTGRVVTLTNSAIFDQPTHNYSRMFDFRWEELKLPLHYDEDLAHAEAVALEATRRATSGVIDDARRQLQSLRRQFPLQSADLEPQAYLRLTDNWVELKVRFLLRAWGTQAAKNDISREILRRYREEGITIASASFEIAKLPVVGVRLPGDPSVADAGAIAPRHDA